DDAPWASRQVVAAHRADHAAYQPPAAAILYRAQEGIRHAHRVVRILARYGEIGFRIPVGVIGREFDFRVALPGELDDPLDVVLGDHRLARGDDLAAQLHVLLRIEAVVTAAQLAGRHDGVEVLLRQLGAGDEGRNLLLLDDLPVDELLDVRVIDVADHHLGGAPRGAARLDRAGGPVADLQEAHQARRPAAPRQLLVLSAQAREVASRARSVFEPARLAH